MYYYQIKMGVIKWTIHDDYLYGSTINFKFTTKIALFDLDSTLVIPKSGKKFPENENDWKWCFKNVKEKINANFNRILLILFILNSSVLF